MTRIIAGVAGSIRLAVPGTGTRPTSDRVREALFSALEARGVVSGARVLDLYAGSGALGLEALSRGAASAVLVDRAPAAVEVMRKNAARVAEVLGSRTAECQRCSVEDYLARPHQKKFDLVFIDPPYDLPDSAVMQTLELLVAKLSDAAVVAIERGRQPTPGYAQNWPAPLRLMAERRYGETTIALLEA